MAEMLAAIFGAVLGFIPGLGAILQSVLKWAAALIEWAVTVFAQVLSKMGSIAGRIAFAATSAIAAGAVQLGEDLLSQEIANAIVGLPDLKVDWKGEAISTALGAGAGGVGGWVHFPKIADKPAPKFPNSLTGKVGGDTGLPGINVNPKLGSPGDTSVTASSITPPAGAANVGAVKVNRLASGGTEATALPPAVETRLAPATSDGGALPATKTVAQPPPASAPTSTPRTAWAALRLLPPRPARRRPTRSAPGAATRRPSRRAPRAARRSPRAAPATATWRPPRPGPVRRLRRRRARPRGARLRRLRRVPVRTLRRRRPGPCGALTRARLRRLCGRAAGPRRVTRRTGTARWLWRRRMRR